MAEDAAELDAEALLFLEELVVDDGGIIGTQSLPALSNISTTLPPPPDDAELLSSLLASPSGNSFGNAHGALSFAVPQLEPPLPLEMVLPLDFFPPSDDETDQHPHIRTARTPVATRTTTTTTTPPARTSTPPPAAVAVAAATATKQTTALKTKRKKPNRSANYNPNRARNERRHELIYLKQKVAEMEQELLRLHDKTDSSTASSITSTTPLQLAADDVASQQLLYMHPSQVGQLSNSPLDAGVWERIASRQLNERRRAERENERLRIVLETQLKIARSLEHLLHKRTTMQGLEETGLGKQKRVFANSSVRTQSDELIFDELLRQVHACYLDAEAHFERMGIGATEVSCRDARIRDSDSGGAGGMDMEIFANEVLPFELHTAGKAAWQYFSIDKNHLPYRLYYERVRENKSLTEDTIIENSGLELRVNNTKAIFNLKQVLRRYVEPDRVVIAYSALAQPVEFDNKPIWGCDFREYGCMVLKRPVTHDPSTHAVLKTCYFIVPEFYGHNADDQDHRVIGELTEFVLSSTAATMAAWLQMIENILVVEHIGNVR